MTDKFIYQKKDFVNIGVPEGSFGGLIKKLNIDNSEYRCFKRLGNNVNAKFFTEEAMQIVLKYLNDKEKSNNRNELALLRQNTELKNQIQQMQNALTLVESQHTKELAQAKEEWHAKEIELIKDAAERDKQIYQKEQEIKNIGNMNFWQFRKWKKTQIK